MVGTMIFLVRTANLLVSLVAHLQPCPPPTAIHGQSRLVLWTSSSSIAALLPGRSYGGSHSRCSSVTGNPFLFAPPSPRQLAASFLLALCGCPTRQRFRREKPHTLPGLNLVLLLTMLNGCKLLSSTVQKTQDWINSSDSTSFRDLTTLTLPK